MQPNNLNYSSYGEIDPELSALLKCYEARHSVPIDAFRELIGRYARRCYDAGLAQREGERRPAFSEREEAEAVRDWSDSSMRPMPRQIDRIEFTEMPTVFNGSSAEYMITDIGTGTNPFRIDRI